MGQENYCTCCNSYQNYNNIIVCFTRKQSQVQVPVILKMAGKDTSLKSWRNQELMLCWAMKTEKKRKHKHMQNLMKI